MERTPLHSALVKGLVFCALMLTFAGLYALMPSTPVLPVNISAHEFEAVTVSAEEEDPARPVVLNAQDKARYRAVYGAQRAGKWEEADALLAITGNSVLKSSLLAERYLDRRYDTSAAELKTWLQTNPDHPKAGAIYRLAVRKYGMEPDVTVPLQRAVLNGYGGGESSDTSYRPALIDGDAWIGRDVSKQRFDHVEQLLASGEYVSAETALNEAEVQGLLNALEADVLRWELAEQYLYRGFFAQGAALAKQAASRSGETMPAMHWLAGIGAWQRGDISLAASHFSTMAGHDQLSPALESSAAFWAWRAHEKLGNHRKAARFLAQAAEHPRTFYGVLAQKALKRKVLPEGRPVALTVQELRTLLQEPPVRRAVALVQVGKPEAAEQELRRLFPASALARRQQLLALAAALDLPAAQISMAYYLVKQGVKVEQALYPMPEWQPKTGFGVEPALVFAFARQESGFHAKALGAGGALGLMQLMPKTASLMRNSLKQSTPIAMDGMMEPEANIALGQHYLQHLMQTPMVGNNLFYLAAAYNAGPGRVSEWKKEIAYKGDPLLFLELIPYATTRHYVKQVMTNYWIYQELEGRQADSAMALLSGDWPEYTAAPVLAAR